MGAQAVRLSNVDIDNALKNEDFEVLFQPIFDLSTGAFARVEAFVRWRHRALGVLPPGAFISYFETQGRMSELTRYVLDRALAEYLAWRGPQGPGFSINLALSDLADDGFANHLSVHLRDRGIAPELITLECPMPPVTMALDEAAAHFERLSETGVRLAIEVRGRANDFLKTIEPFPFDEIKTGGAAILRFARTVRGPGLSAIAELLEIAKKARSAIVAVGVEDQASLAALRSLGFTAAQGNHLAQVGTLANLPFEKVVEVRRLLGLAALSDTELAALAAPLAATSSKHRIATSAEPQDEISPQADDQTTDADQPPTAEKSRKTIERLNARIVRESEARATATQQSEAREGGAPVSRTRQNDTPEGEAASAEAGDRTRIRAALGAKNGSALTKAAAIAKAKRKVGAVLERTGNQGDEGRLRGGEAGSGPDTISARRLFERLTKAFDRPQDQSQAPDARSLSTPAGDKDGAAGPRVPGDTIAGDLAMTRENLEEPANRTTHARTPSESAPAAGTVSLPISGARAYFRSSVYVTATQAIASQSMPPQAESRDDIVSFKIDDAPPASLIQAKTGAPEFPAPPALRDAAPLAVATAPVPEATPSPLIAAADGAAAQAATSVGSPRIRRRRKMRRYISLPFGRLYLPPRHFWPKSWTRKQRIAKATEGA